MLRVPVRIYQDISHELTHDTVGYKVECILYF